MFWFKIDGLPTKAAPVQQFVSFEDSIACFIERGQDLVCDTQSRRYKLTAERVPSDVWLHFTLSIHKSGDAYLRIHDHSNRIIAHDSSNDIYFTQTQNTKFQVCLGNCDDNLGLQGFNGGIREVILRESFIRSVEIVEHKNRIEPYMSDIRGYFRFTKYLNQMQQPSLASFLQDQFRSPKDPQSQAILSCPDNRECLENESLIGEQRRANDVCPLTFDQQQFVYFSGKQQVESSRKLFERPLDQSNYAYTMSVTFQMNQQGCYTSNIKKARNKCNIVLLENVFMMYFEQPNQAKFYFFAEKNYYDSQSLSFFVPMNEWVTVQMQMTHYGGYHILLLNQYNEIAFQQAHSQNMQQQVPDYELSLFTGLDGVAASFVLLDKAYSLPRFADELTQGMIVSIGRFDLQTLNGSFLRYFTRQQETRIVPYSEVDRQWRAEALFDGVTCRDQHYTVTLQGSQANIKLMVPQISASIANETTLEFWFKVRSQEAVSLLRIIPVDSVGKEMNITEWQIYLVNDTLSIAPFGRSKMTEPVLEFTSISEKEDAFQWWHLSCSFVFRQRLHCTLHNTLFDQTLETSLTEQIYAIVGTQLKAVFGYSHSQLRLDTNTTVDLVNADTLKIKEFRYWNRAFTQKETSQLRYMQVDPYLYADELVAYYRLSGDTNNLKNFALPLSSLIMNATAVEKQAPYEQGVYSRQPDEFLSREKFFYNRDSKSLQSQVSKEYHHVCPLYTYLYKKQCYSEPINQLTLAVFPQTNQNTGQLEWLLTTALSSVIFPSSDADDEQQFQYKVNWLSEDRALQAFFDRSQVHSLSLVIPSKILRQHDQYLIRAEVTNIQHTFIAKSEINFTPNKCGLFDSKSNADVQVFKTIPGQQDIQMEFQLVKNDKTTAQCEHFNFYDSFGKIEIQDFAISGVDFEYIQDKPLYDAFIKIQDGSFVNLLEYTSSTAFQPSVVKVTIPVAEQLKIPIWTDIQILFNIQWNTTDHYQASGPGSISQNTVHKLRFEPQDNELTVRLQRSSRYLFRGETLALDTNGTTIQGVNYLVAQKYLSYLWVCPENLKTICAMQQSNSELYIPYPLDHHIDLLFTDFNATDVTSNFEVQITWHKFDGTNSTISKQVEATWINQDSPVVGAIKYSPTPLVSTESSTKFTFIGQNFDASNMTIYTTEWSITPAINDSSQMSLLNDGESLVVQKGQWAQFTDYTVAVKLRVVGSSQILSEKSVRFQTFAPPQNGTVTMQLVEGQTAIYSVGIKDWVSPQRGASNIYFKVWSARMIDNLWVKQTQITSEEVPMGLNYILWTTAQPTVIVEVICMKTMEKTQLLVQPGSFTQFSRRLQEHVNTFNNDQDQAGQSTVTPQTLISKVPQPSNASDDLPSCCYFLLTVIGFIHFCGLFGSLVACRLDHHPKDVFESTSYSEWSSDILLKISQKLNEPIEQTNERQADLLKYFLVAQQGGLSLLQEVTLKIHPLTSWTSNHSSAREDRCLTKLLVYYLQVNLYVVACFVYYGLMSGDQQHPSALIDSADLESLFAAVLYGSIWLLPWFQNHSGQSNILLLAIAACLFVQLRLAGSIGLKAQMLSSSAIFGAILIASLVVNLLRAALNCYELLPSRLSSQKGRQVVKDVRAVQELVRDQTFK